MMVNTQKSILHRAASVHRAALNDRQICQFLDEKSQMLSIALSLSVRLRLFLSRFLSLLSHALD